MAAIKALSLRINSTKSIEKITSSMKMVAASKLRGDEMRLNNVRPLFESMIEATVPGSNYPPETGGDDDKDLPQLSDPSGGKYALVTCSSDRGLCGAVNTFVVKTARQAIDDIKASGGEVAITTLGDKSRAQLDRTNSEEMLEALDEIYMSPMNFSQASAITDTILQQDFSNMAITFNRFKSAIAYDTSILDIPSFKPKGGDATDDDDGTPVNLKEYEFEPEDRSEALANLREWVTAVTVYGAIIENVASEQSARMTAMDNASKNAGEMIESLTLKYNRARQAAITTELIEIISGAAALEG